MRAKLSVLRACHRVLKPEGRIAYYTIFVPPDLSEAEYRGITRFRPLAATGRRSLPEMLESAGFTDVRETNVTKQYRTTVRDWLEGRRRHFDGLAPVLGEAYLKGKIDEGVATLAALKNGLLRRSLLTARRPA